VSIITAITTLLYFAWRFLCQWQRLCAESRLRDGASCNGASRWHQPDYATALLASLCTVQGCAGASLSGGCSTSIASSAEEQQTCTTCSGCSPISAAACLTSQPAGCRIQQRWRPIKGLSFCGDRGQVAGPLGNTQNFSHPRQCGHQQAQVLRAGHVPVSKARSLVRRQCKRLLIL
jgi:hypothetical protein